MTKDPTTTFYLSTRMSNGVMEENQHDGKVLGRVFDVKGLLINFQK